MLILSVESTCDETAVAVTENGRKVLTDQIFSQADLHAVYGGVVPEIASRSTCTAFSRSASGHSTISSSCTCNMSFAFMPSARSR